MAAIYANAQIASSCNRLFYLGRAVNNYCSNNTITAYETEFNKKIYLLSYGKKITHAY